MSKKENGLEDQIIGQLDLAAEEEKYPGLLDLMADLKLGLKLSDQLDELGKKINSYNDGDGGMKNFLLEQISNWHRFSPDSNEDKQNISEYYHQLIEIIEIFKDHPCYEEILGNNHYFCIGRNHDRNFSDDKKLLLPINRFNNFILKNRNEIKADYLELLYSAWDIDEKHDFFNPSNGRRTHFDLTTNIFSHYADSHYKDIVLSSASNLFYKFKSKNEITPQINDYLTLLLDVELGPQNKKEAMLYSDAISQDISYEGLISLIYEVRDYENIKKVNIHTYQNYCLDLKNRIKSDLKYSLDMNQISVLVGTYNLVNEKIKYWNLEWYDSAMKFFFDYLNESMGIGDDDKERRNNLMSFCYETQRLIKEDPELFRTSFMQTYCEVGA